MADLSMRACNTNTFSRTVIHVQDKPTQDNWIGGTTSGCRPFKLVVYKSWKKKEILIDKYYSYVKVIINIKYYKTY